MATLLFLRMPRLRPIPLLLIGAGLLDAIWEVGWLATWLTDRNYVACTTTWATCSVSR